VEKRNPYQSKNRRRRPEPTLASLLYPAYSTLTTSHVNSTLFSMQTYDMEPVFCEMGLRY